MFFFKVLYLFHWKLTIHKFFFTKYYLLILFEQAFFMLTNNGVRNEINLIKAKNTNHGKGTKKKQKDVTEENKENFTPQQKSNSN